MFSRKRLNKRLLVAMALATLLASCGGSDGGGGGVPNFFANGFTGNSIVDNNIISQIQCDHAVGNGSRATVALRDTFGQITPLGSVSIPNPQGFGGGFQPVGIGRTTTGDVIVAVFAGGYTDIVISLCHRSYVTSNIVQQIQYALQFNSMFNVCGYGSIGTQQGESVQLVFGGGFGPPTQIALYPTPIINANCGQQQFPPYY